MRVDVREFEANLSAYIARAAEGEDVVITTRNQPVARLVAHATPRVVERSVEDSGLEAPRSTRLHARLHEVRRSRSQRSTIEVLAEDRGRPSPSTPRPARPVQ